MSCPACYSGFFHEGEPRGVVTKIHGRDTYVVEPAEGNPPKGLVVIIPDAFGWDFVNIRLLADKYADQGGYKVYAPDFMDGRSAPTFAIEVSRTLATNPGFFTKLSLYARLLSALIPFAIYNWPSRAWPRVKGWFEQLRKDEGASLSIGATGFCWGGKFVVMLGAGDTIDGRPLMDAGFTAHPSLLSLPTDIEKIKLPVSFAIPEFDDQISEEKAKEIKATVEAKPEPGRGELTIYRGAGHGFAVRADMTLNDSTKPADEAIQQSIKWFDAHFSSASQTA